MTNIMKVSSSHSSLLSKTHASFGTRLRVASLKQNCRKHTQEIQSAEEKARRQKLQKSLDADLKRGSHNLWEPEMQLPDHDKPQNEQKLWRYFEERMTKTKNKVEKQQINACERQFKEMGKLINHRKETHLLNLSKLKKIISDKNFQINQLFEQIKRDRMNKLILNMKNKKNKKWIPIDNKDQVIMIKENINNIRIQIANLEKEHQSQVNDLRKLVDQWIFLLTNLIKKGYFMSDGFKSIFQQMIKHDYCPSSEDFPDFMDLTTISFLLKQFQSLKKDEEKKKQKQKYRSFSDSRKLSPSIRNIREIAKQPQLKMIYQGTKDYMATWLKNGSWREQNFLPRIKEKSIDHRQNWQPQERKRMARTYSPQTLKKVKSILFGPKVELLP